MSTRLGLFYTKRHALIYIFIRVFFSHGPNDKKWFLNRFIWSIVWIIIVISAPGPSGPTGNGKKLVLLRSPNMVPHHQTKLNVIPKADLLGCVRSEFILPCVEGDTVRVFLAPPTEINIHSQIIINYLTYVCTCVFCVYGLSVYVQKTVTINVFPLRIRQWSHSVRMN